jgi:hypothetical protein
MDLDEEQLDYDDEVPIVVEYDDAPAVSDGEDSSDEEDAPRAYQGQAVEVNDSTQLACTEISADEDIAMDRPVGRLPSVVSIDMDAPSQLDDPHTSQPASQSDSFDLANKVIHALPPKPPPSHVRDSGSSRPRELDYDRERDRPPRRELVNDSGRRIHGPRHESRDEDDRRYSGPRSGQSWRPADDRRDPPPHSRFASTHDETNVASQTSSRSADMDTSQRGPLERRPSRPTYADRRDTPKLDDVGTERNRLARDEDMKDRQFIPNPAYSHDAPLRRSGRSLSPPRKTGGWGPSTNDRYEPRETRSGPERQPRPPMLEPREITRNAHDARSWSARDSAATVTEGRGMGTRFAREPQESTGYDRYPPPREDRHSGWRDIKSYPAGIPYTERTLSTTIPCI